MSKFTSNIRPYVERELSHAASCLKKDEPELAFSHLENAHVLGQKSTRLHVAAHVGMLRWAINQRNTNELLNQIFRIIGAATKTAIGWVPIGNTGGANVSPFKPMQLSPEHAEIIARAETAA